MTLQVIPEALFTHLSETLLLFLPCLIGSLIVCRAQNNSLFRYLFTKT